MRKRSAQPSGEGRRRAGAAGAILAALLLPGCSTPGPLHLYAAASGAAMIDDAAIVGTDTVQETPSYLGPGDVLTGFAYDPYTDHFFLRLAPGTHIRVVDRPAKKIKREMDIECGPRRRDRDAAAAASARVGGDLAVSPRDGHLFLVDGAAPDVVETTRFGKFVRRVRLRDHAGPIAALAFDMERDRILALDPDGRSVHAFSTAGEPLAATTLAQPVAPSLAYDSTRRELYAPLAGTPRTVGVFDEQGRLVRTIAIAAGATFIDVGPHSFLRIF